MRPSPLRDVDSLHSFCEAMGMPLPLGTMKSALRSSTMVAIVILAMTRQASAQGPVVPAPVCESPHTILALGASVLYPGIGHVYIGGGEQRRGHALAITATAGLTAMLASSFVTWARPRSDHLVDAAVWAGTGAYTFAWAFATSDIVPATIRERRRCARGDRRASVRVIPTQGARTADGRSTLGALMIWSVAY